MKVATGSRRKEEQERHVSEENKYLPWKPFSLIISTRKKYS
jgi:hypothetical protein